ncbi:ABC transporter ATP-binding protein [Anaerostipes hadrus]|uniref:ABC transporter ATP-binding protein n=1 Tax=Anaerostipes hadrus TaxID=649756 RepID=UPI00156E0FC0|nr:ABC transporter ATP-binding protein [Anaerostipes hadrus]MCB5379480.1 ABC transporter ATP-binding protein/permease [Anaerostipes hadrus]NSH17712.1 ABC transporter ATP-binding protein [Anaerostipes hadrus]NSH40827.1 ABC transporter ATP-binding protein [Anaerostipes hadrus]NSH62254.1 ABC transporter ATP-binding protein [Anaerostipes hadrus]
MKRLLGYLKEHLCVTILAPLFKMLEASFELFVPLVVASMIDVGIGHHDIGYLWKMGGLLILLGIIGFSFSITAQYFAARSAVYTGKSMRSDLFAHMNQFSYQEIDQVGTSTLINRMSNDINQVQNGVNMFLRLFLRSPFVVFGAMFMAFTVDHKAAISFVFTITALAVVVGLILWITMPMYKKVQKQVDGVLKSTRENLLGIRVIRAFNRQRSEEENFRLQSGQLYNKQIHVGKISALLNPLTYMIINLGIIAILWSGGKQVDLGYLTQGQIIALINYMSQILVELVKLANLLIILSRAFASLDRVDQIFALEPSMKETGKTDIEEKKDTSILEFKDTSFVYHGARKETIHPFDFVVKEGETIGVIGGTGSGKSTFVSLIARLYDVTSGRILYRGVDEKELKPEFIRGKIGFVPQKASLFEGSLRDNMKWGKEDATDEEIYQALDIAQAREFVDQKEQGLDFRIEQNGGNLSGGQKQRLTIARALVRKPEILILDDSASALDFATDARLRKAIKENTDNMTVFLVSQRVSTIRNADHILVLDDGKIAGIGTHLQLLKENQVYKEICASQMVGEEA